MPTNFVGIFPKRTWGGGRTILLAIAASKCLDCAVVLQISGTVFPGAVRYALDRIVMEGP